ncbi:MAG: hypothetical protein AAF211_13640, partial [Myxococcota bacterium]
PEQIRARPVGPRTDQYGFGVLLYHMLTGDFPFARRPFTAMLFAHLNETPRVLVEHLGPRGAKPGVQRLSDVVAQCLAKDAAHRFADMEALMAVLSRDLDQALPMPLVSAAPAPMDDRSPSLPTFDSLPSVVPTEVRDPSAPRRDGRVHVGWLVPLSVLGGLMGAAGALLGLIALVGLVGLDQLAGAASGLDHLLAPSTPVP